MRNKKRIRMWMIGRGYTQIQICRETETSAPTVSLTIAGQRNNQAVLAWLRERGCPEEYLGTHGMAKTGNTFPVAAA